MRQIAYLALLLAIGCADDIIPTPTAPLTSPTPTSGTAPSGDPSSSPSPSLTPGGSPAPSGSPTPSTSPTPSGAIASSPGPSGSPTPTGSPSLAPLTVSFEAPLATADYTANTMDIRLVATPAKNITIKEINLYYDDTLLLKQASDKTQLELKGWNPHVKNSVNNQDATEVGNGLHTLRAEAVANNGEAVNARLTFQKPVVLRGWINTTPKNGSPQPLPPLTPAMWDVRAVANRNRVFALFGRTGNNGSLQNDVQMLNVDVFAPQWETLPVPTDITSRLGVAIAVLDDRLYLAGGHPFNETAVKQVCSTGFFDPTVLNLPDLPTALTDASAAVLGRQLYVAGGRTGTSNGPATRACYRLSLDADGKAATTANWETVADLPPEVGPVSGALVAHDNALYWLGGDDGVSRYREAIAKFNPAGNRWAIEQYLPRGVRHAAVASHGGFVWVLGGEVSATAITDQVVRYDPQTRRVTTFPNPVASGDPRLNLPGPLAGAAAVSTGTHLYLLGGNAKTPGSPVPQAEVWRADLL